MQQIRSFLGKGYRLLPSGIFTRIQYFKYQKKVLHLAHPRKYSEMLMWLKVHGRLERYSKYADKYGVREIIAKQLGEDYSIPLLGVWDSADEVDFDKLPKKFVLKATHGCEYNIICKDKSKLDIEKTRLQLAKWLEEDFYMEEREPQYKDIKPRVVAEKYIEDESGQLRDYKFYCAKGEPKLIQFDTDRFTGHKSELLDTNWVRLEKVQCATFSSLGPKTPKPKVLDKMLEVARILSRDFWFVRVDMYLVGDKIYFGELTFTPGDAMVTFDPPETGDAEFLKLLGFDLKKLPKDYY